MESEVRFALLGPVSVDGPEGPIALGSPKQRTVLAALLLHANRTVSDDRLVDLIWGERSPRTAVSRLQVYIHELRALVGKERISRVGAGYRIHTGADELDLQLFEGHRAAARADAEQGRHTDAVLRLRAAAGLWRGPALAGTSAQLIRQERPGLEDRRICALEELYDSELAAGRHAEIVGELHTAVAEHPLRERLLGQLMLALHRCERRGEALAVYRESRRRLVDELGIEPGRPLRELHQRLLRDDEPGSPGEGAHPAPLPPRPEPFVARPAELPRDVPAFAARDAELAWLDECLAGGDGVCVLSGTAGMGKTALALHWAHRAKDRFPDGQLYLDLRGYDPHREPLTPTAALTRLLVSLGVDPERVGGGFETQLGLYRSLLAGHSYLLVLDNARAAAQIEQLLPPNGVALVTSRHRLGELVAFAGARQHSLGPLSEADGRALLDGVLGPAGGPAESHARGELVRACGGLPLALRIAAANAAARPEDGTAAVAAELAAGNPLAGLTVDGAKDNAVTVAFSASYRLLAPADQRVFRLLGLVPGPDVTVAAAAAVTGLPRDAARASLRALAAAHLLEHHITDRYRFHDLVRLYAVAEAGRDSEREPAWQRLFGHYLELGAAVAARCAPGESLLSGPQPGPDARELPSPEAADVINLLAALRCAIEREPGPAVWRLADMVRAICARTGRIGEWMEIAPPLLEAASAHDVPAVTAMLHTGMGDGLFRVGRREEAVGHLEQAVRIACESGEREGEAAARMGLSFARAWTGDLVEAMADNVRAAQLFGELGSVPGQVRALNALGYQHHHLGRLELAEEYCRQALALSRRHDLPYAEGADLRQLGAVLLDQGRYGEAETCLRQSLALITSIGGHGAATTQIWISRLHWENGRWAQSRDEALAALGVCRGQGDRLVEAAALVALADAGVRLGLTAEAADSLDLAGDLIGAGGLNWHLAYALLARARLLDALGDQEGAVRHALRGHAVASESAYRLPELAALTELAKLERRRGDREAAARRAGEVLRLCREIGHAPCEKKLAPLLEDAR
ncbi:AfsR/SARP family transcriptional regulator [Nonomuraea angiospora]|uniref:DNA-binding SARP family transcriptional activator/tetratricopeptide (TPR) repeat protein n=3 Tax=Nonomuraea angiospora TaxID=46172 RepID=A0ABR9LUF4_9ACTN|nr:BTAD domain-containing putative transcriptional regulator [Nonomuraea angiospora]MBE1583930.1 DNA-binding SARP family transcriptional activator/tetratricopeptide (TPR) repeat protein [Nonomuraea angiospora]